MFFDTNEIRIQAFVDFINGKWIIFNSSSSWNIIYKLYIHKIYKISIFQNFKISKFQRLKKSRLRFETHIWDSDFEFFETQICKENIFPRWFHILSNIFWGILVYPKINKVGFGALRHVKTLRNHEIWSFRPLR